MNNCLLCKQKSADQTGSHILTYSLIKSAINQVGKNERGKELTFGISSKDFLSLYFGERVLPEKLEETLKRDVTDEDIEKNENPFTIDNIVCTECEKRFTTIENCFLNKVQNKLNDGTIAVQENKKYAKHVILDEELSLVTRLNFYIQIWRASVSNYEEFRLDLNTEEKLRKIIDSTLTLDIQTTIDNCIKFKLQINQFPFILTHTTTAPDESGLKKTENVVYIEQYKEPHFFILNDFYVQFYCNEKHINRGEKSFFKLNDLLKSRKATNLKESRLVINLLDDSERRTVLNTLYRFTATVVAKNYVKDFTNKYIMTYGTVPSVELIRYAVNILTNKYGG